MRLYGLLDLRDDMKASAKDPRPIGRRSFLGMCLAAGACLAVPAWLASPAQAVPKIGDMLPPITLNDLKGKSVTAPTDFKGQVVLVHFWASWCTACRPEMAALESLYTKYRAKGVIPCSVDIGESREAVDKYLKNMNVTYPVLMDPKSATTKLYGIGGIPTTYILNREGVIKFRIMGEISKDGLEKFIKALL